MQVLRSFVGMESSAHDLLLPDMMIFPTSSSVTVETVLREGISYSTVEVNICILLVFGERLL